MQCRAFSSKSYTNIKQQAVVSCQLDELTKGLIGGELCNVRKVRNVGRNRSQTIKMDVSYNHC